MPYFNTSTGENKEQTIKKGIEWFDDIQKKIELNPKYNNYFIVIDIDSGQFFLGETERVALKKAEQKLGKKNFFIHLMQFF